MSLKKKFIKRDKVQEQIFEKVKTELNINKIC